MPGGRGSIDHLAVVPSGVFVIDAKQYSGKVRVDDGGFRGLRLVIAEVTVRCRRRRSRRSQARYRARDP